MKKTEYKKRRYEDERINAPLISWKVYFILMGIEICIMAAHTAIVAVWMEEVPGKFPILILVLFYFLLLSSVILALVFGVLKRYVFGKPLKGIAAAARRVASGEFSVRISPIRQDGKKDEIEVLIEDFNTMAKELESIEMLKNDFVSNVSHEIKTPISVIQNYASAFKMPGLSEEERNHYADVVIRTTRKLNDLVVNILRLSKIQNQEIVPKPENFQLGEQIRQCALAYMEKWEEKKIQVHMEVEDIEVCADQALLELVWNNLLSNAVKFTEEGGDIYVRSGIREDFVWVEVQDTGCGIPEDEHKRIFDRFYQGDTSHATEGNGLGLALAKEIMEILSGSISVKSNKDQGTAFTVTIPLSNVRDRRSKKETAAFEHARRRGINWSRIKRQR